MTRVFLEDGKQIPVTVLQMENLQVVSQRTNETDGYTAVQLGAGVAKVKRQSAAMRGHFAKARLNQSVRLLNFASPLIILLRLVKKLLPHTSLVAKK